MTNKFKVGDKVEIIGNEHCGFKVGTKGVISYIDGSELPYRIEANNDFYWHTEDELKLIDNEPSENQRITKLEEEVAELKLIVAQIRKPSTVVEEALANDIIEFEGKQYKKVDREAREGDVVVFHNNQESLTNRVTSNKPYPTKYIEEWESLRFPNDDYEKTKNMGNYYEVYKSSVGRTLETVDVYELIVEDKLSPTITVAGETREITHEEIAELISEPKTANQLRAEIIEKAKGFVEDILGKYDTFNTTIGKYKDQCVRPVFQVNEKKRAITVLIYGAFSKELVFKGITKCHPKSVFNVWIGKAIALGRALGLDVSEFEQAVQPTHATGQVCKIQNWHGHDGNLTTLKNSNKSGFYHTYYDGWLSRGDLKIINDTKAQYSSEVNE